MVVSVPKHPGRGSIALRAALSRLLDLLAHRRVEGLELVPRQGPCVVVFNQLSLLDTALLSITLPRPDVTGLVARDYRRNPLYRLLVEWGGGLWIRRGESDRVALKGALDALARGWMVGISPEGRRSRTGGLIRGRPGPAFLAFHSGAPVLPMAFTNTTRVLPAVCRLRRVTIGVRIGPPFRLAPREGLCRKRQLHEATDIIMSRLAALLPVEYRGAYADPVDVGESPTMTEEGHAAGAGAGEAMGGVP